MSCSVLYVSWPRGSAPNWVYATIYSTAECCRPHLVVGCCCVSSPVCHSGSQARVAENRLLCIYMYHVTFRSLCRCCCCLLFALGSHAATGGGTEQSWSQRESTRGFCCAYILQQHYCCDTTGCTFFFFTIKTAVRAHGGGGGWAACLSWLAHKEHPDENMDIKIGT